MTKQNFIARALCSLGGDKYTKEGTEASLQKAHLQAQQDIVRFDIQNDKWILLSDLHKGAKNRANDFQRCEEHYLTALNYYFEQGFNLCVMGDAEELWEEFPHVVIQNNSNTFAIERKFHEAGRYMRLWGNHDEIWGNPKTARRLLEPLYGHKHLEVLESILMEIGDGNETLGNILLIHGHQGTQNEGQNNDFTKWVLHNIWRPLQVVTGLSCNTPATDWKLRYDRDKIIYHWAANQPGLVLIAGHTHTPVFASYSHRARLLAEIASLHARLGTKNTAQTDSELIQSEKLSSELQALEKNFSAEELKTVEPLENPLPCYFNTGCCCFEDGDITGIEISAGEIRLVRWPDDEGNPKCKVLQSDSVQGIFNTLKQSTIPASMS